MKVNCPCCYSESVENRGKISQNNVIAGTVLDIALPECNLFKCGRCELQFKWPTPDHDLLINCYKKSNLNTNRWQYRLSKRLDWQISLEWINKNFQGGDILDIACWDGKFLENLNGNWKLSGVELNSAAADIAKARKIKIVANSVADIEHLAKKFDVITAFDIMEHIESPLELLKNMVSLLKTGGQIIVSSGNTSSPTWKFMGNKYGYCSIPEHLSFINPSWCNFAAKKLNLKIETSEKFSRKKTNNPIRIFKDILMNMIYFITPTTYMKYRKIKKWAAGGTDGGNSDNYPPSWETGRDHILVIFRKQ